MATSPSELLFPRKGGTQHPPDVALHKVLRRALGRAGLVVGYRHVCRRKGCGHAETKAHAVPEPCPRCGMKLWPGRSPARFASMTCGTPPPPCCSRRVSPWPPCSGFSGTPTRPSPPSSTATWTWRTWAGASTSSPSRQSRPPRRRRWPSGTRPRRLLLVCCWMRTGEKRKAQEFSRVRETPGPFMVGETGLEPATPGSRTAATGTTRSRGAGTGRGARRARGYGLRSAGGGGGFGMFARGLRPEPMTASARSSIGASAEKSAGVATAVQAG